MIEKNDYLDETFLTRAKEVTSFNLYSNDLTTIKYKNEVRNLITSNWFPNINESKIYSKNLDKDALNESIALLKEHNSDGFDRLYSYNMKGVGPGEMMLYYMIDDASIGGGSSSGVDLIVNENKYEIKAVKPVKNKVLEGNFLNDFKLGGTINLTPTMKGLQELANIENTELAGSKVNAIRNTEKFKTLESDYREKASDYFQNHQVIFVNNSKKNNGEIINIGKVETEDIFIERMTSGTVKPLIKIHQD